MRVSINGLRLAVRGALLRESQFAKELERVRTQAKQIIVSLAEKEVLEVPLTQEEISQEWMASLLLDLLVVIGRETQLKKVDYLRWAVKMIKQSAVAERESIVDETIELLKNFHMRKDRLPVDRRDINAYRTLGDLRGELEALGSSRRKKDKADMIAGADVLYENPEWIVHRVKTREASCVLGRGTKWCIAATQSHNYFDDYTQNRGFKFIFLTDRRNDEKYALAYSFRMAGHSKEPIWETSDEVPFYYELYDAADQVIANGDNLSRLDRDLGEVANVPHVAFTPIAEVIKESLQERFDSEQYLRNAIRGDHGAIQQIVDEVKNDGDVYGNGLYSVNPQRYLHRLLKDTMAFNHFCEFGSQVLVPMSMVLFLEQNAGQRSYTNKIIDTLYRFGARIVADQAEPGAATKMGIKHIKYIDLAFNDKKPLDPDTIRHLVEDIALVKHTTFPQRTYHQKADAPQRLVDPDESGKWAKAAAGLLENAVFSSQWTPDDLRETMVESRLKAGEEPLDLLRVMPKGIETGTEQLLVLSSVVSTYVDLYGRKNRPPFDQVYVDRAIIAFIDHYGQFKRLIRHESQKPGKSAIMADLETRWSHISGIAKRFSKLFFEMREINEDIVDEIAEFLVNEYEPDELLKYVEISQSDMLRKEIMSHLRMN